jgi:hypothetical protein
VGANRGRFVFNTFRVIPTNPLGPRIKARLVLGSRQDGGHAGQLLVTVAFCPVQDRPPDSRVSYTYFFLIGKSSIIFNPISWVFLKDDVGNVHLIHQGVDDLLVHGIGCK